MEVGWGWGGGENESGGGGNNTDLARGGWGWGGGGVVGGERVGRLLTGAVRNTNSERERGGGGTGALRDNQTEWGERGCGGERESNSDQE